MSKKKKKYYEGWDISADEQKEELEKLARFVNGSITSEEFRSDEEEGYKNLNITELFFNGRNSSDIEEESSNDYIHEYDPETENKENLRNLIFSINTRMGFVNIDDGLTKIPFYYSSVEEVVLYLIKELNKKFSEINTDELKNIIHNMVNTLLLEIISSRIPCFVIHVDNVDDVIQRKINTILNKDLFYVFKSDTFYLFYKTDISIQSFIDFIFDRYSIQNTNTRDALIKTLAVMIEMTKYMTLTENSFSELFDDSIYTNFYATEYNNIEVMDDIEESNESMVRNIHDINEIQTLISDIYTLTEKEKEPAIDEDNEFEEDEESDDDIDEEIDETDDEIDDEFDEDDINDIDDVEDLVIPVVKKN